MDLVPLVNKKNMGDKSIRETFPVVYDMAFCHVFASPLSVQEHYERIMPQN